MSQPRRKTGHKAKQRQRPAVSASILATALIAVVLVGAAVLILRPKLAGPASIAGASAPASAQALANVASPAQRAPTAIGAATNPTSPAPVPSTNGPAPAAVSKDGPIAITAEDGLVRLAVSDISQTARFYTYQASGKTIRFFVLKSSDGVTRAALDACDVCFAAKKGYHQEGDVLVCNNCGNRFPSFSINEVQGGCNPVPLLREIQGSSVIIKADDLAAGVRYF